MDGLAEPGSRFRCRCAGLVLMQDCFGVLRLRLREGSLGLVVVSLSNAYGGVRLIDLIDSYILLLEERLDTVSVIGGIFEVRIGSRGGGLRPRDSSLGHIHAASCSLDASLGTVKTGHGCIRCIMLGGNFASFVDDLLF